MLVRKKCQQNLCANSELFAQQQLCTLLLTIAITAIYIKCCTYICYIDIPVFPKLGADR